MNAINCDDPLARCDKGSLFRVNSTTPLSFEGRVNGVGTGVLPMGERMLLPNSLPRTANSLEVILNGTTYPICSRVQDFNLTKPQDLGVLLSEVPEDAAVGPVQMEQEMLVLQVVPALAAGLTEGEIDPGTADNGLLLQVALAILVGMEAFDEATGAQALFNRTSGGIDLRTTGTDGPPALADAIAAVNSGDGRRAVRAIVDAGKGALKVARNATGALMIIARMKPGLSRMFIGGVAAALTRNRMAQVITGTKSQFGAASAGSTAASVGKGAVSKMPIVGWLIVGVIDVVEWYGNPSSRGDWSLLFSMLIVDGVALYVSAVAAMAVAGMAAAAFGAALTVGAAVIVLAAGIFAGVAVGMVLTWVAKELDLVRRLDQTLTWAGEGLKAIGQGAIEVTSAFADRLMQGYEQAREWADEKLDQAGEWAGEKAREAVDWHLETANDVGEWINEQATDVGEWANQKGKDIQDGWNAARDRVGTAIEGLF